MAVSFNHTIVWARDSQASATFFADVLGLPAPKRWGPFVVVTTDNGTNLDFMNAGPEVNQAECPRSSIRTRAFLRSRSSRPSVNQS